MRNVDQRDGFELTRILNFDLNKYQVRTSFLHTAAQKFLALLLSLVIL